MALISKLLTDRRYISHIGCYLGVTDSKRDGENTDQAFERVYKFVEDKLTAKILEAQTEAEAK